MPSALLAKSCSLRASLALIPATLDPSHPLGGPDGAKDARVMKDGALWVMAVYFPRGEQDFTAIKKKFLDDYAGVATNNATGMAFVTNQELHLGERKQLLDSITAPVEIFHLERVTAILDQPAMQAVRAQFPPDSSCGSDSQARARGPSPHDAADFSRKHHECAGVSLR